MSGTFAVTTNDSYSGIPYNKASSFRINNNTGKLVGVRRKHKTIRIDDFEDLSNPEWTGDLNVGYDHKGLEGRYAAQIKSLVHRPITSEQMLDGSEVEVSFRVPDIDGFNVKINILDDITRLGIGYAAEYDKVLTAGHYRVIFGLFPTQDIYTVFEEKDGGERDTVNDSFSAVYGSNDISQFESFLSEIKAKSLKSLKDLKESTDNKVLLSKIDVVVNKIENLAESNINDSEIAKYLKVSELKTQLGG